MVFFQRTSGALTVLLSLRWYLNSCACFFLWEKTKRQHHTDPTADLDEVSRPRASASLLPLPHKTHRKEGKYAHGSAPAD